MRYPKRRKLLINPRVQGALIARTLAHWSLFLLGMFGLLFVYQVLADGPEHSFSEHLAAMWQRFAPALVVLLALVPVVVYDTLRLGHRVVGPIFRLQSSLRQLAEGRRVEPLKFRKEDFWHDLAGDFNQVAERIETDRAARQESPPELAGAIE